MLNWVKRPTVVEKYDYYPLDLPMDVQMLNCCCATMSSLCLWDDQEGNQLTYNKLLFYGIIHHNKCTEKALWGRELLDWFPWI